jgi:GT2 family glycosyltransferase
MGVDNLVLIGVNYRSAEATAKFVGTWSQLAAVTRIVVVDNYSSDAEARRIGEIARSSDKVSVLSRSNDGYGAALNAGIEYALTNLDCLNALVLFGNVDVYPVSIALDGVDSRFIPEIVVIQDGKARPPFLTKLQKRFIGLTRLAVWSGNPSTLGLFQAVNKLVGLLPSVTWAVHGSQFALTGDQLAKVHPIFDPRAFLYCEELFFARRVMQLRLPYRRVPVTVEHLGAVSTGSTAENWTRRWFATWRQSAKIFFEDAAR